MSTIDSRLMTPSASSRPGLLSRMVGSLQGWNDARRTHRALSALSDRDLNDIGLSRGDIDRVCGR